MWIEVHLTKEEAEKELTLNLKGLELDDEEEMIKEILSKPTLEQQLQKSIENWDYDFLEMVYDQNFNLKIKVEEE